MQKKLSKLFILVWLTVAVVSAAFVVGGWITQGWESVRQLAFLPLIATALFLFRLFLHKRIKDD